MNKFTMITVSGLVVLLTGCTTSSKVQEMIDASHQDYSSQLQVHGDSIAVLKKSSMAGLEKSKANAETIATLQADLEDIGVKLADVKKLAEASKVMSAANTVKVSELGTQVEAYHRQVDETVQKLAEIDKLFENVMLRHYEMIVQSANEAMSSLKSEAHGADAEEPVRLDEPIEIVAPNTSVPVSSNAAAAAE